MKPWILIMVGLVVPALPAVAVDLGNRAPAKPATTCVPPAPDPTVIRQGGDTIADAVAVPIPYSGSGTTTGYTDDYNEDCPFFSWSSDVVYSIEPTASTSINIDLCGSAYDTKVFVYDEDLVEVACNDDFYGQDDPCGVYVSKIEQMPVTGGIVYYVVVDGYGGDHGDYVIEIAEYEPCDLECPAGATDEDEPPLAVDYEDTWNGGCNTDYVDPPFQPLTSMFFCGVSGCYTFQGSYYRDTDWFTLTIGTAGLIEITGDAEQATIMFELGPHDCNEVGVLQDATIGPCNEAAMLITGEPGAEVWFWVGPLASYSPDGSDVYEYEYTLNIIVGDDLATQYRTFSEVKALFD